MKAKMSPQSEALLTFFYAIKSAKDVDKSLEMLRQLLAKEKFPETGVLFFDPRGETAVLRQLLNLKESDGNSVAMYEPFFDQLTRANDVPFFQQTINCIFVAPMTIPQIYKLLDIVYAYCRQKNLAGTDKINLAYMELFYVVDKILTNKVPTQSQRIDSYLSWYVKQITTFPKDELLVSRAGQVLHILDLKSHDLVLDRLLAFNAPEPIVRFLQLVAPNRAKLSHDAVSKLDDFLHKLSANSPNKKFVDVFVEFGFVCMIDTMLHHLSDQERLELLSDPRIKLSVEEVKCTLKNENEPLQVILEMDYLNALSRNMVYTTRSNPARPPILIQFLRRTYNCLYPHQAEAWTELDTTFFEDVLTNPIAYLNKVSRYTSIPTLIALFEQLAVLPTTKSMYFIQKPYDAAVTFAGKSSIESIECKGIPAYRDKKDFKDGTVFAQCCETFASDLSEEDAKRLFTLLLSDPDLHPCITDLLSAPNITDLVLIRYKNIFLQTFYDPNTPAALRAILVPLAGIVLEAMPPREAEDLISTLITAKRYEDLRLILQNCRQGGAKLRKGFAEYLSNFFAKELLIGESPLKSFLFPRLFASLSGTLVPLMDENTCRDVLVCKKLEFSLELLKGILPEKGPRLSDQSRAAIAHRSSEGNDAETKVQYVMDCYDKDSKVIADIFGVYISDPVYGTPLFKILLKNHFVKYFPNIHINVDVLKPYFDSIGTLSPNKQFEMLNVLLDGIDSTKSANRKRKTHFLAVHVFTNKKILSILRTKLNEGKSIFSLLVMKMLNLETDTLKAMINNMIETPPFMVEELKDLLLTAIGMQVITKKDTLASLHDNFRPDIIQHILSHKALPEQIRESILRCAPQFIQSLTTRWDSPPNILQLFIDFGCRPNVDTLAAEDNEVNIAVRLGRMEILLILIPLLPKKIPLAFLERAIHGEWYKGNELEVFRYLFDQVKLKDPDYAKDPEMLNLFNKCLSFTGNTAKFRLEIFNILIASGVEPRPDQLRKAWRDIKDAASRDKLFKLAREYAPNAAIKYNLESGNSDLALEIFNENDNKEALQQDTLCQLADVRNLDPAVKTKINHRITNYTEHQQALAEIKSQVDVQEKRRKKAVFLSLIGIIVPFISHLIILIWYFAGKSEVSKVQMEKDEFLAYKKARGPSKPAFDVERYERTKSVQKKLPDNNVVQRKLIEFSSHESGPVTLFFATKKNADRFNTKVKEWRRRPQPSL